uniref:Dol-P-Glc:Glc(2)Man(9)GlcNAc(2)-PP-Dol alpha-1,2-glucosyltransferase n=1 Tax=Meloidogyne incognita TaxID=6306 RepID=A0A914L2L3_MELIC
MDEIFHVAQTRLYCRGIYNEWNPMITTPPGLYFLAVLFGFCGYERYLNSLILPFCFAGLCRLRRFILIFTKGKLKKEIDQFRDVRLPALAICFLPVLLNNSFLYYTDLLSLTAFIWGISFNSSLISSMFLALAVLTRQTFKFIHQFLLVFAFMCFLVWNNGSIVLGDKTAHKPVIHLPQLFYFVGFTAASSMPLFISYFFQNYKKIFTRFSLISMLFISLFALLSVNCCTLAHPYLLADNRHFTFYLWQRFFQRHWIFVVGSSDLMVAIGSDCHYTVLLTRD